MTAIAMTSEQVQKQIGLVDRLLANKSNIYNLLGDDLVITSTFEGDHAKLHGKEITDSTLWIIHPSSGRYYQSRVRKSIGSYIGEIVAELKQGNCQLFILQQLWKIHPFFVLAIAPNKYNHQIEHALTFSYTRGYTKRNHSGIESFSVVEVSNTSGMKWRVVMQGQVLQLDDDAFRKINLSVSNAIKGYNTRMIDEGQSKDKHLHIPFGPTYHSKNTTFMVVEELNRAQVARKNLELSDFNRKSLEDFKADFALSLTSSIANQSPIDFGRRMLSANVNHMRDGLTKNRIIESGAVKLISCQSRNGVIGLGDNLHPDLDCAADMLHFAATTTDHVVIMGRKTWESLPATHRPLSNRINVVLTRSDSFKVDNPDVFVENDLVQAILKIYRLHPHRSIFIIGGAELYKQALETGLVNEAIVSLAEKEIHPRTPDEKLVYFDALPYLKFPHEVRELPSAESDTAKLTVYWSKVKL